MIHVPSVNFARMAGRWRNSTPISWVEARDHRVMRRLNQWRAPRWLRIWMIAATRAGDGWLWYAAGLVIAFFGGPERFPALAAATGSAVAGVLLFLKLKRGFRRQRPCALEPHCWAKLLPPDQFSFPSGHTITAFAVVVPLASYYPGMEAGLMFSAVSIAMSRIVLGLHFVSDVIAGAIIGAGIGTVALEMVGALGF